MECECSLPYSKEYEFFSTPTEQKKSTSSSLSQLNKIYIVAPCFTTSHSASILRSMPRSLKYTPTIRFMHDTGSSYRILNIIRMYFMFGWPCILVQSCKQIQLDAQFCLVYLFLFSTCFGQPCAHHQEKLLYLCDTGICHALWVASGLLVSFTPTSRPDSHPKSVTNTSGA
jgi:hypothetical protein